MPTEYPYMVSNNKIKPILDSILTAAKPTKFSHEFVKKLGYASSNDRAVIPVLKGLGFIQESGAPTEYYDDLKDSTKRFYVLGDRIKYLYKDLYSLNESIHSAPEDEIKGAISRITGKDATSVSRYFATFKTLASLAKFDGAIKKDSIKKEDESTKDPKEGKREEASDKQNNLKSEFHYNIQIHLPATTDVSVYNAIFKSLKENLLV